MHILHYRCGVRCFVNLSAFVISFLATYAAVDFSLATCLISSNLLTCFRVIIYLLPLGCMAYAQRTGNTLGNAFEHCKRTEISLAIDWYGELDHPHTQFYMLPCCKSTRVLKIVYDFWATAFWFEMNKILFRPMHWNCTFQLGKKDNDHRRGT